MEKLRKWDLWIWRNKFGVIYNKSEKAMLYLGYLGLFGGMGFAVDGLISTDEFSPENMLTTLLIGVALVFSASIQAMERRIKDLMK